MKHFFLRLLLTMMGVVFFAFGVVLTIKANIGYAPWDVFHVGLADTIGLSIGTVSISVGVVLVTIIALLGERQLGIGTILNMMLIGVFVDAMFPLVPISSNIITGIIMLLTGIFSLSLGTCFYLKSAFGIGPRDALMVVLARKTKLPVGICRFAVELAATVIGWFFGGMVGVGTVIFVIVIGPCVQIVFKLFKLDVTAVKHETLRDTFGRLRGVFRRRVRR